MNLSDLRALVGNLSDYDPNTTAYNGEIDRIINDTYLNIYAEQPWSFAQREVRVAAFEDTTITDVVVTANSTSITAASGPFLDRMEGYVIELDGIEYEIAQVSSTTQAYLTASYEGSSGTVTGICKHRYVDLPENCVSVLQVGVYQYASSNQPLGRLTPLSRYEGDHYALSYSDSGTPAVWLTADSVTLRPPVVAPTLSTRAGTAWPAGDYEIAVCYNRQNRYSGPCATVLTYTSDGTTAVVPRLTFGTMGTGSGYRRAVYVRPPGFGAFRLVRDDIAETASTVDVTSASTAPQLDPTFEIAARMPEHGGTYQRIRLHPRQGIKYYLTIRYLARPFLLLEEGDSPEMPEPDHHVISEIALTEIYAKSDQLSQSEVYRRKAILSLARMESQYLTQRPRRWVKQGWSTTGIGIRPLTTITHLG